MLLSFREKKIRETVKPPIHVLFVKYNGIKIIKYTKEGFTKKKAPRRQNLKIFFFDFGFLIAQHRCKNHKNR